MVFLYLLKIPEEFSIQEMSMHFSLMNIFIIYYKNGENNKISEQKAEPIP